MTMELSTRPSDPQALTQRLERLERTVRAQRRTLVTLASLAGVAAVAALLVVPRLATGTRGWDRTLEARRVELKDPKGRVRVRLDANAGGGLAILGEDGKTRAGLVVNQNAAALYLNDQWGTQRAVISALPQEKGYGIGINDAKGRGRVMLMVGSKGTTLTFRDKTGKKRMALTANQSGPVMVLRDKKGRVRAGLRAGDKAGAMFALMDEKGRYVFRKP